MSTAIHGPVAATVRRTQAILNNVYRYSLDESSPRATQPSAIVTPLKPHQLAALHKMLAQEASVATGQPVPESDNLSMQVRLGVLADKPGAGKSLTLLSLIAADTPPAVMPRTIVTPCSRHCIVTQEHETIDTIVNKPSLIIVPLHIYGQWKEYITTQTRLSATYIATRAQAVASSLFETVRDSDVVLISHTMMNHLVKRPDFDTFTWRRCIVDEADTIKWNAVAGSTCFSMPHAHFYWAVTPNFINILFTTSGPVSWMVEREISVAMDVLDYEYVQRLMKEKWRLYSGGVQCTRPIGMTFTVGNPARWMWVVRNRDTFVDASFHIANPIVGHIECKSAALSMLVADLLPEKLQRFVDANDVASIYDALGIVPQSRDSLVRAVNRVLVRNADELRRSRDYHASLDYPEHEKAQRLAAFDKRIERLETRMKLVQERITQYHTETCAICMCEHVIPTMVHCCCTVMCLLCLQRIVGAAGERTVAALLPFGTLQGAAPCPMCREPLRPDNWKVIADTESLPPGFSMPPPKPTKVQALLDICCSNSGQRNKVIIFASNPCACKDIAQACERANVTFALFEGPSLTLERLIERFRRGNLQLLCISKESMGAGMNLPEATHVVFFHRVPSDIEAQMIGRAQRLGREKPLTVQHLCHLNELPVATAAATVPRQGRMSTVMSLTDFAIEE
jgi:hypothetical protein